MGTIDVTGLTKIYRMRIGRARVREMTPSPFDQALARAFPRWWWKDTFRALDDVSFHVDDGASVGVVGHNGAGKTTLLKMIAGVAAPNAGEIVVTGRVGALIDAIIGFHPDLTGEENAYLLGAMFGFGRRSMAERLERVMGFAELTPDQAATPVKRFSAGMSARLGFGVITSLDLDVLLVDEVLAVGDANFQRKCIRWLDEYRQDGGTLVFVSHNLGLIRNMTDRVVWIDGGRVVGDGRTADVLADYARAMETRAETGPTRRRREVTRQVAARGLDRWGAGGVRVESVHVDEPVPGSSNVQITIDYESSLPKRINFTVGFLDENERELGSTVSSMISVPPGRASVRCSISPLPFREGIYFPIVAVTDDSGLVLDRWRLERAIVVEELGEDRTSGGFGPIRMASVRTISDEDAASHG
jgi:lipopolysaccharide transport system ATP-binding protein